MRTMTQLRIFAVAERIGRASPVWLLEEGRGACVYHALGERQGEGGGWRARCGPVLVQADFLRADATMLRADHAEAFARPCKRCYPGGVVLARQG